MDILSQLSWRQQLGVRRVSHQWLATVDACLAHRQELKLIYADQEKGLNAERLINLLQSMPALKRLCVNRRWTGTNSDSLVGGLISVEQLCDSCPQLQEISLDCELDDADVETLLRRLPGLLSLHLDSIIAEGDCLSLLPAGLKSVTLSYAEVIKSASLRHLTRCRELRELDLTWTMVLSEDLAVVVAACPLLERLSVHCCPRLTGTWLSELSSCPQLRDLDLSVTNVRSEELAAMAAACPQLERLDVDSCWEPTGAWLLELRHCPQLRDLDLSRTKVRSEELATAVAACPQLERLSVAWCEELTGTWLPELRHCPRLRDLDLSVTNVRSEELAAVRVVCPQLERLDSQGCH